MQLESEISAETANINNTQNDLKLKPLKIDMQSSLQASHG
jgi:hypothetical protein